MFFNTVSTFYPKPNEQPKPNGIFCHSWLETSGRAVALLCFVPRVWKRRNLRTDREILTEEGGDLPHERTLNWSLNRINWIELNSGLISVLNSLNFFFEIASDTTPDRLSNHSWLLSYKKNPPKLNKKTWCNRSNKKTQTKRKFPF